MNVFFLFLNSKQGTRIMVREILVTRTRFWNEISADDRDLFSREKDEKFSFNIRFSRFAKWLHGKRTRICRSKYLQCIISQVFFYSIVFQFPLKFISNENL